jgi:hypothetical protein
VSLRAASRATLRPLNSALNAESSVAPTPSDPRKRPQPSMTICGRGFVRQSMGSDKGKQKGRLAREVEEGLPMAASIVVEGIAHNTSSTSKFGDFYRHVPCPLLLVILSTRITGTDEGPLMVDCVCISDGGRFSYMLEQCCHVYRCRCARFLTYESRPPSSPTDTALILLSAMGSACIRWTLPPSDKKNKSPANQNMLANFG